MGEERQRHTDADTPRDSDGAPSRTPTGGSAAAPSGTSVGVYAGLGFQFTAAILVFAFLGQWLDRRYGTEPWLLLLGVFVGGGGAFYSIYRKLMADLEREERRRREERGER